MEHMLLNILFGISLILPLPQDIQSGFLSQYAKGPTDGTIAYRQEVGQLPADLAMFDGVIAVPDCDRMGDLAWLNIRHGEYTSGWLIVAVFDCSGHESTTEWMKSANILAEGSYYLARDHGFLDQGNVQADMAWASPP